MKDSINPKNQWLVLELKVCWAALGITQQKLADLSGMSLDSIKRLEKSGAEPRFSTINKLRKIFNHLGVKCAIDERGTTHIRLRPSMVNALNKGTLSEHISERIDTLDLDEAPEPFDESD